MQQININNMATLISKDQKQNTVNDNKTQQTSASNIFTTNHHYNCHNNNNKQQQNNNIKDGVDDGDFYHIKWCYQPKPKTTTKSSTLNQRTNFNFKTPPPATTTTTTEITKSTTNCLSHVLHLFSYNCRRRLSFVSILLLCYLLLIHNYTALAAPQSCILCDKNDLLAKDPQRNYEEFLFEHQVTRQDAINALRQLNDSFYEGTSSDSSCNGVRCTEKVMKYCLGPQFINDHCWCELGHSTEGLPFIPHICYVGEKIYKTSVGSCFFYEEVKDCCCSSVLAKEWRHISAGSSIYSKTWFHNYYVLAVITLLYLLIRRSYN